MEAFITDLFMKCVYILQVMGGAPGEYGYGYYLANILVFVVLQPGLILLFFLLWRRERRLKNAPKTLSITFS
ncbi:MAG TPA: hypothetical protein DCG83_05565 [Cryomorphaceae bacterium]|nr:hypothetical protein [Cryomorphaceae bacterium]|tara:strand:- start:2517 stop:2732 length:216 start_codon:yes stop_codon:yes gene_type:complete